MHLQNVHRQECTQRRTPHPEGNKESYTSERIWQHRFDGVSIATEKYTEVYTFPRRYLIDEPYHPVADYPRQKHTGAP